MGIGFALAFRHNVKSNNCRHDIRRPSRQFGYGANQVERTAGALGQEIAEDERHYTEPCDALALPSTWYLGMDGTGILEVFGEHTLSVREILGLLALSVLPLAGNGFHATRTALCWAG